MIPYSLNSIAVKKGICPQCGYKNKFVFYVNNETLEMIGYKYGKCDRIESCQYHLVPNHDTVTISLDYTPPEPKPILYHPYSLITASGTDFKNNNFVQFLRTLTNEEEVKEVIQKYLIGTAKKWPGATVFWQVDSENKVRHGKIMLYDKKTGKRAKNNNGDAYISSVRNELKLYDNDLKQCLFGLHLINEENNKVIAVVESEKTAIIMSIFMPEHIWTSCGSLQGFKHDMLVPLMGFKVIAFPDKGCYKEWHKKAKDLNELGLNIFVTDDLEYYPLKKGSDIADIFIKGKDLITDKIKEVKPIKTLTKGQIAAQKFSNKNPAFDLLVKTFDLDIF